MIRDDLKKYPKAIWVHFYKNRISLMAENGIAKATEIPALLQITTNGKLNPLLAKGAAYESLPWSAFSG